MNSENVLIQYRERINKFALENRIEIDDAHVLGILQSHLTTRIESLVTQLFLDLNVVQLSTLVQELEKKRHESDGTH